MQIIKSKTVYTTRLCGNHQTHTIRDGNTNLKMLTILTQETLIKSIHMLKHQKTTGNQYHLDGHGFRIYCIDMSQISHVQLKEDIDYLINSMFTSCLHSVSSFINFILLAFGFKVLTVLPLAMLYVRARDKCGDPDFKETYLRDMLYKNNEINALFKEETIHVLDYDCEYDRGYPCPEKFPEFKNKFWQFFNTDTSMTTGYFKMADVETGAVMNLKFKTMPVPGKYRYQIGEPFYFYDLRAEITHNGQHKEVVLVDEKVALQKVRPFLLII
ncbi:unnamed protein product (macronuclear) [Paramecium tetraurelia]|uniref:AMP-activated protein kinase glycogen-binding domain-containing protein n=1 Tax=Paramecium tetraurelia TaxID=5888 RepID=A0D5E4_PARTE|nr:uncharacterized protein GSPATT00013710001 [Paramecium tetraurelia]CAK78261.1 unnamed protein product [Paramecium tetraurelia]|eukprot:XP_001445658.1 hypothetical protein (macronuclear) [Paramecium tetraurelia strain d4-2]